MVNCSCISQQNVLLQNIIVLDNFVTLVIHEHCVCRFFLSTLFQPFTKQSLFKLSEREDYVENIVERGENADNVFSPFLLIFVLFHGQITSL